MRCVVEGYGSIGKRHADLLKDLGQDVACVSKREDVPFPVYRNTYEALKNHKPQLYIIATATHRHHKCLNTLIDLEYTGRVLIEKPLANFLEQCGPKPPFDTFIAYNMRFHPIVIQMRKELADEPVVAARLSVGQYLPEWRPDRDYRKTYSAIKKEGGGVLRDLSHELDLVRYFFGPVKKVAANMGTLSSLQIDTEDWVDMLLVTEKCKAITVHLDYLDRNPHRHFVIVTNTKTLSADLWHNTLNINGKNQTFSLERNDSFRKQLQKILADDEVDLCSWEEGIETMRLIKAVEKSSANGSWEKVV